MEKKILKEPNPNPKRQYQPWSERELKYVFDSIKQKVDPRDLIIKFCKKYDRNAYSLASYLKHIKRNLVAENKKNIYGVNLNDLEIYIHFSNKYYSQQYFQKNKEKLNRKKKERRDRDLQDPIKAEIIRLKERERTRKHIKKDRKAYNEKKRIYYHKNREKCVKHREKYRNKNLDSTRARARLHYYKNREEKKAGVSIYRKLHPEVVRKYEEKQKKLRLEQKEIKRKEYEEEFNKQVSGLEKRLEKQEKIEYGELPDFIGLGLKARGMSWCCSKVIETMKVTKQALSAYKYYEKYKEKTPWKVSRLSPDKIQTLLDIIGIPHLYVDLMQNLIDYAPKTQR